MALGDDEGLGALQKGQFSRRVGEVLFAGVTEILCDVEDIAGGYRAPGCGVGLSDEDSFGGKAFVVKREGVPEKISAKVLGVGFDRVAAAAQDHVDDVLVADGVSVVVYDIDFRIRRKERGADGSQNGPQGFFQCGLVQICGDVIVPKRAVGEGRWLNTCMTGHLDSFVVTVSSTG